MSIINKTYDLGEVKESNIQKNNDDRPYHSQVFSEDPNYLLEDEANNENNFSESESSREDYLPINEGNNYFKERSSIFKGISLAFIFFSVIIYSLLYMLAPEKEANLIFEGQNLIVDGENSIFYKLDTVFIKQNTTIFNLSLNVLSDIIDEKVNIVSIAITYTDTSFINNITLFNYYMSKELKGKVSEYKFYKTNDYPFWLYLFNRENDKNAINITSDYLINLFQI